MTPFYIITNRHSDIKFKQNTLIKSRAYTRCLLFLLLLCPFLVLEIEHRTSQTRDKCLSLTYASSPLSTFHLETRSHYVAQAILELSL